MKRIMLELSDEQFIKLDRQKMMDGFTDKEWKDWLLSKSNPRIMATEVDLIQLGNRGMRKLWYNNVGANLAFIRRKDTKSLRDLAQTESNGSALVVGAGPSVGIHKHLDVLKNSSYDGTIVSSDKMLKPLLEKGIVPDYVLTVDGTTLIVPFYKNKYFREHVKDIKVLLHFTANPKLVRYLYGIKADIYWYIVHVEPVVTSESDVMSVIYLTQTEHKPDGLQTIMSGGNVGVGCWCFSWVILKKKVVMLIGMDMGYPEGTPLEKTYYYSVPFEEYQRRGLTSTVAAQATSMTYNREYNSDWKSWAVTDQVFREYRSIFCSYLDMSPAYVTTINCTEGGTLSSQNSRRLQHMTLEKALKKYRV